jgi:hypothetical protein
MAKLRKGVDVLDAGGGFQMNGVGGMEVGESRSFVTGVIDGLRYALLGENLCWRSADGDQENCSIARATAQRPRPRRARERILWKRWRLRRRRNGYAIRIPSRTHRSRSWYFAAHFERVNIRNDCSAWYENLRIRDARISTRLSRECVGATNLASTQVPHLHMWSTSVSCCCQGSSRCTCPIRGEQYESSDHLTTSRLLCFNNSQVITLSRVV